MNLKPTILSLAFIIPFMSAAMAQQINIPRIEQMPNRPSPYKMRNWQRVAAGYDSLIFDLHRTGQYLPLVWKYANTVNYPQHESFGLETVVGTPRQNFSEAINVLPAVVGATLAGIDKSDQNGEDWVLMCEEYFNRRPEENVYLNQPVAESGDDWWYETMPNVFFYQLYDLYPNTGDFEYQFVTVANQWLRAVQAMGGSAKPWHVPNMNYRAWSLSTMTGRQTGVKEPEAAGAIAWLLYHAYAETGDERYRLGAEWAMEFLNGLRTNPSYELQLPYGVYTAARMNAELGTSYDIEKMVNWCFEVGPLRSWGAILGTWGGHDVHGLIGEVSTNDYAFLMNGFEQAGALAPMARYDDRFTRAIGKWVLNLANAARLFYAKYLPAQNQDSEAWSFQYDPRSYIGYEALRKQQLGQSPFATGDAVSGGWGYTNLALYGSSHVGILGGILDTTDVPMILRLDMLKTDYFRDEAYPTYLYFNPYPEAKTVRVEVGPGMHDIYDAASNAFVATGVSDAALVAIPPDAAMQLVLTPAGGVVTYELDRMKINGVVVDYHSGRNVSNYPPRIKSLAAEQQIAFLSQSIAIYATADDRDNNDVSYAWHASGGSITGSGSHVTWTAPEQADEYQISLRITDSRGGSDSTSLTISVIDNYPPQIIALTASPASIDVGELATLTCQAIDADGGDLTYTWDANAGSFSGSDSTVIWNAPDQLGYYLIACTVTDDRGATTMDAIGVTVGRLVAFYPFAGTAGDASGFSNDGMITGAAPAPDRFGNPGHAFTFDGADDVIRIPSHPTLNFQEAISINFWMTVTEFLPREAFPISHGSWQNRWKVSLIPGRRLRWTVKTDAGVVDLDSATEIQADSLYNVTVTYGDGRLQLYLNGVQSSQKEWSGALLETGLDLTIGQMVPGDNQYYFKGILDEVRIYNVVLPQDEIRSLYDISTAVQPRHDFLPIPDETRLLPNYPNPFNPRTTIIFQLRQRGEVKLDIFNLLGQKITTLLNQQMEPGVHRLDWNARGFPAGVYFILLKTESKVHRQKMLYLP